MCKRFYEKTMIGTLMGGLAHAMGDFVSSKSIIFITFVIGVPFAISCYTGLRNNENRGYIPHQCTAVACNKYSHKQRVLMHGHQGWNVRHGLCHIYMIYVYIWVVYSFCLFCCLFIIVTTQFVALYKPCKLKPKPSTYDPPDNHPLAEIQIPILRPEPKQQICHQHEYRPFR